MRSITSILHSAVNLVLNLTLGLFLVLYSIPPSYSAMLCGTSEERPDEHQLCSIFEKVEARQGCADFKNAAENDVCLSLQNLMRGGSCSDEFGESQPETLITCEEIYRGLTDKTCSRSKIITSNFLHPTTSEKKSFEASLNSLCELGNEIPKNRIVFKEIRKNALLMQAIEPNIQHLFSESHVHEPNETQQLQKVRNLASHILKRLDELKIGEQKGFLLNQRLKNIQWITYFKNLVEVLDKHSNEWIERSKQLQRPIRLDPGTLIEKVTVPSGIIVFPDGRIVVIFDRLLQINQKERELKPIGEGGFKRVYLAFDYGLASESLSDGFNDQTALVGGYIKFKRPEKNEKAADLELKLIQEVRHEFETKKRWTGQEGIAKSGDLVDLQGQTEIKEKLILLEPYYPSNLIKFRTFLSNPSIESINGKSKESVILNIAKNLVTGLNLLHSHQIHHRDIKPDNILIDAEVDGNYHGFISDFGLALDLTNLNDPVLSERVKGTLEYMAPETLRALKQTGETAKTANQNLKNDVWGMGLSLYYLEKGGLNLPAFSSDGAKNAHQQISSYEDLKLLFGINFSSNKHPPSNTLQYVIYRMLDPSPEKRITSQEALQLINELPKPGPWSNATDLLANIKLGRSFASKTDKFKFDKAWTIELQLISKDTQKRFKKEILIYARQ